MVEAIAVIPARLQSKRLDRKLLLPGPGGKPLLYFAWFGAKSATSIKNVWIATDNAEIEYEARKFGANVVLTSGDHTCGTDRVCEAYSQLQSPTQHSIRFLAEARHADIIINVQGDEPDIRGQDIDKLVLDYAKRIPDNQYCIGTLAVPLVNYHEYSKPQNVKVIFHKDGEAIYFSRGMIPWISGIHKQFGTIPSLGRDNTTYKHIGVYAYTPKMIKRFVRHDQTRAEQIEGLEQLRAIENKWPIYVTIISAPETDHAGVWPIGINTKYDYDYWIKQQSYF